MSLHQQMEKTIALMKAKPLKEHKCTPNDIAYGDLSFGKEVGHGRRTATMKYAFRRKVLGVVKFDGKNITIEHRGQ